ncbi:MAG: hypothetical protein ACPGEF_02185 [Endozoicomonas sp.]
MFFLSSYSHPEANDYIESDELSALPIINQPLDLPSGKHISLFTDEILLTGQTPVPSIVSPRSTAYLYQTPIDFFLTKLPKNEVLKFNEINYEATVKLLFLLFTDFMNDIKTELTEKTDNKAHQHHIAKLDPMFLQFHAFLQDLEAYLPANLKSTPDSFTNQISNLLNVTIPLAYDGVDDDEYTVMKIQKDYNAILSFLYLMADKLGANPKVLDHLRISSLETQNCDSCGHIVTEESNERESSGAINIELSDHMTKIQEIFKETLDREKTVQINVLNAVLKHIKENTITHINKEFEICLEQIALEYETVSASL